MEASKKNLLSVCCFCIGTDQTDLKYAESVGVPVFNSPFCNSRSVAELVIAEIITLSRKLGDVNINMHNKIWNKSATGSYEVRGKILGIVGYGHIGSQLSVLAESIGMKVCFYDIGMAMPLGNSKQYASLEQVLRKSDFVTLHVPQTDLTKNMIGKKELEMMKRGSYLINASRGTVVILEDLEEALNTGHIAGAAIDVYQTEPEENIENWEHPLQKCKNVILTPHIGGSTEQAQEAIGREVAEKIIKFLRSGTTMTAVNFPNVELPLLFGASNSRIINVHHNVPGVLKAINEILVDFNIVGQYLKTEENTGYVIIDVNKEASNDVMQKVASLKSSIKTRILF